MATLFDDVLTKGIRAGQIPAREQKAREWYRNEARSFKNINENKFLRSADKNRLTSKPLLGQMYFFVYDAKHKATLPYWDRFPLIFPFKKVKGGFLGINLHYLPLPLRARLMDALYTVTNNDKFDETTKLRMNYQILNSTAKMKYFKPCIKHYLTDHLKSRFMYVYPAEWDVAMFLPLERFQGATKNQVYKDSRDMLK